jgi:DNA segregation ATPase FtsK/SpoIIIE, S-DNA-T family
MVTHSPRDVQIYGIDMGGGLLRVFEQAPHVGAICGKTERDKVRRVVRQVLQVIEEREFFFRESGIDTMATLRARRQSGEFPDMPFGDVFLLIDNFGQFSQEFDQLEADLLEILANGLSYGVHLVLAVNRWAEVRTRMRDNIGTRLELRLNDPQESELGKATASALPIDTPGRGATRDKLFFQVALPVIESETLALHKLDHLVQQSLGNLVQRICLSWKGEPAPPVYMLPSLVSYEELPPPEKQVGVPLALEEFRLSPLSIDLFSRGPHFMVLGDSESGKTSLLRTWMRGIERCYLPQEAAFAIVDFRKQLLDFAGSRHLLAYAYNALTLTTCLGNLKTDLEWRLQKSTDVPLSELGNAPDWSGRHFFLFVDDYENLLTSSGNPLTPLVDYILSARDIGFHLILARRVGGIGRASYEAVFQRLREMGTSAIILSGDPTEGKILYGVAARYLPPGRGYFVQPKYPPTLVQAAFAQPTHAH